MEYFIKQPFDFALLKVGRGEIVKRPDFGLGGIDVDGNPYAAACRDARSLSFSGLRFLDETQASRSSVL